MGVLRLQCAWGADTAFPRDRMVITPHFNDTEGVFTSDDPQSLVDDLATGLQAFFPSPAREIRVTAYDAAGAPPHQPRATKVLNLGAYPASRCPREVALCLSFYADTPSPKRRGRLYIPATGLDGVIDVRPSAAQRTQVSNLVSLFSGLGGADIDWSVWSRTDQQAHAVTNWWVDDEWDTVRSRGMRPTTRTSGSTAP